jgi:hypothetical protein
MFGRIFGRGKDEPDQAVCASCGRTLLAGEWTQKITDRDGEEKLICSLCSQSRPRTDGEEVQGTTTPANAGKVRESRGDSDAFWKTLKDKDVEIDRLRSLLARAEAEKQELLARLARNGQAPSDGAPETASGVTAFEGEAAAQPAQEQSDENGMPELAAETWGETPAELAAALAEFEQPNETQRPPGAAANPEAPAIAFVDTQPIPTLGDELPDEEQAGDKPAAPVPSALPTEVTTEEPSGEDAGTAAEEAPIAPILADGSQGADAEELAAREEVEAERAADAAASLTLLQRGVDLLNISTVPHKIAETNEHLGLPSVHVGFDGQTTAVTFLWSMGWYRFSVDIDSGVVRMDDRGYDERRDLQPNAGIRADGTVHLAPAQISRAAAQRQAEQPAAAVVEEPTSEAEPPSMAAQKAPEFVSKSLLGQRSDDEPNDWDGAKARDFNWDH